MKQNFVAEFFKGAGTLFSSFLWFFKQPKSMFLGIIPAFITLAIFGTIFVITLIFLPSIVGASTGFTDDWQGAFAIVTKILIGASMIAAVIFLFIVGFSAVTLAIGDKFYNEIWKEFENAENNFKPTEDNEPKFSDGLKDTLTLVLKGVEVGIVAILLNFIPIVGTILSLIVGSIFTGHLLTYELSSKSMDARGVPQKLKASLLKENFWKSTGLGVSMQLCFLIPLGAVFLMPAAVVAAARFTSNVLPKEYLNPSLTVTPE